MTTKKKELVRVPMTVVIPTAQYANVQPQIEGIGETFEEAYLDGYSKIKVLYASLETPVKFNFKDGKEEKQSKSPIITTPTHFEYCAFDPEIKVAFDEKTHTYDPEWIGGSTFAGLYVEPFEKEAIAARMAKEGASAQDIMDMWQLNSEVSTSFGTSLHNALELYGKYRETSKAIKKGSEVSAITKNPVLKELVELFYEEFGDGEAYYEPFVANEQYKICGFIDRLKVVDRSTRTVRVQDYKTNADILKEKKMLPPFKGKVANDTIGYYSLQLSFYAFILMQAGYNVEGMDIFWPDLNALMNGEDGVWKKFELEYVDVEPEIKKIRG